LWLTGGFHRHEFYIRIRVFALTPNIQDKSRMREIRSYGSVRGALGDQSPYRDCRYQATRCSGILCTKNAFRMGKKQRSSVDFGGHPVIHVARLDRRFPMSLE